MNVKLIKRRDNTLDIIAKQGTTWAITFQLKISSNLPFDLTDWCVRSHIRKNYSDPEPIAVFQVKILDVHQGLIMLFLPANTTSQIPAGKSYKSKKSRYVFDVEVFNKQGIVLRPLQGRIFVDPEVTK